MQATTDQKEELVDAEQRDELDIEQKSESIQVTYAPEEIANSDVDVLSQQPYTGSKRSTRTFGPSLIGAGSKFAEKCYSAKKEDS